MTPIAIATEDSLSEAIALRLIADIPTPHFIQIKLGRTGNGYLMSKMKLVPNGTTPSDGGAD